MCSTRATCCSITFPTRRPDGDLRRADRRRAVGFLWFNAAATQIFMADTARSRSAACCGVTAVANQAPSSCWRSWGLIRQSRAPVGGGPGRVVQATGTRVQDGADRTIIRGEARLVEPQIASASIWIIALGAGDDSVFATLKLRSVADEGRSRPRAVRERMATRASACRDESAHSSAGGSKVSAWDDDAKARERAGRPAGFALVDLRRRLAAISQQFVLAPGVPLTHPSRIGRSTEAAAAGVAVIGDIELSARRTRCPARPEAPLVAITGTRQIGRPRL